MLPASLWGRVPSPLTGQAAGVAGLIPSKHPPTNECWEVMNTPASFLVSQPLYTASGGPQRSLLTHSSIPLIDAHFIGFSPVLSHIPAPSQGLPPPKHHLHPNPCFGVHFGGKATLRCLPFRVSSGWSSQRSHPLGPRVSPGMEPSCSL